MEQRLKEALLWREKRHIYGGNLIPSAVLIPIINRKGHYHILLTKRTSCLKVHKGQISFPGGSHTGQDGTLLDTALRESQEEIGMDPEDVEIIGELDDTLTYTTNYVISPFVAFVRPFQVKVNRGEIDEVLEVPLSALLDKATRQEEVRVLDGRAVNTYSYNFQGRVIWGATARILDQILEIMAGIPQTGTCST
jgi:8-oxo-dGTP pyrophosphatase MutT (NUDIX family)